jgi:hypothetical protein
MARSSAAVYSLFLRPCVILFPVPDRWCTVTVVDAQGRRHSLDLQASSLYDAAHIYVCHAKEHPERGHPHPTLATVLEVVIDTRVYRVEGKALQRWIVKRRRELNGQKRNALQTEADAGVNSAARHRVSRRGR